MRFPPRRALLSALLALILFVFAVAGSTRAQDDAPPNHPPDGTLASIRLLHHTPRSLYYAITYWSDGLRIEGFLGRPRAAGPHPAIIYNRGGADAVGALTGVEIVPLVEAGYVAAASQYRGAGGSEGADAFGGADRHDVQALITLLRGFYGVDPARIGMMGGSRGGMMTYLALKEDLDDGVRDIQAAVTIGGIADLTLWARQQPGLIAGLTSRIGGTAATVPEVYAERSAVNWPDAIQAPLLLLHGGADTVVPPVQSETLYDLLRARGATVERIVYPGGDHPLSTFQAGYPAALDWFAQYVAQDDVDRSFHGNEQAIADTATWFLARQYGQ